MAEAEALLRRDDVRLLTITAREASERPSREAVALTVADDYTDGVVVGHSNP